MKFLLEGTLDSFILLLYTLSKLMSKIFDFNKRFGKEININDLKINFINVVNHYLIEPLDEKDGNNYTNYNKRLFDFIAIEFNLNPSEVIEKYNKNSMYAYEVYKPPLSTFSNNDFEKTLLLIEVIHDYFFDSDEYEKNMWLKNIEATVNIALNQPISLGITWRDGKFYPEGIMEFNEKLISDVLKWLQSNPRIQSLYKNALDHYSRSLKEPIKRKDAISNSFQAVEKLTQEFLDSKKGSFDNNFNALTEKVNLDKEWKKIFNSYKELSKEFGRHAGNKNFIPESEDTEAFLYLSGLILRLILEKAQRIEKKH